jgi:hydrogenase maturation protein HypF
MTDKHLEIRVRGIVQGVGFRPFIYRIARERDLRGYVLNDTEGVLIHVEGPEAKLDSFLREIKLNPPPLSSIELVTVHGRDLEDYAGFSINRSLETPERSAFIPPDSAVCEACLAEFFTPSDRRYHYPFITCTNCGPRFSIALDIPYDRKNTSMGPFTMCPQCATEYGEPSDRRFHTQPDACDDCGPALTLAKSTGEALSTDTDEIAAETMRLLNEGSIIAIKGVGGYLLACDAKNDGAVRALRRRKARPFKPFALMCGDVERAETFLHVSPAERRLLESRERPIVLLKEKTPIVSRLVAPALSDIGIMLPYTPFQYLLFSLDPEMILVMTSGNISDEPIIFRDDEAFARLGDIADYIVFYNREITGFSDDSVLFVHDATPCFIRRSRGFVPAPFKTGRLPAELLATGGDLKNSFALARDDTVILSQFLGDLASPSGNRLYRDTIDHLIKVYHFRPGAVVSDLHPGYFTSTFADELEERGLRRIHTQHHHAHIASVLEDHGIEGSVIGIAYDGTGYGLDGNLWGSEFIIADRKEFIRAAHFSYFPLPGGESAIRDVWKIGCSLLFSAFGDSYPIMEHGAQSDMVLEIIKKGLNSPLTCSIGRIFDGVSAILGISKHISTEAEAAMLLEEAAAKGSTAAHGEGYIIPLAGTDPAVIQTDELIRYVVSEIQRGTPREVTAYLFHLSLAATTVKIAEMLRERYNVHRVALSGGSFQNRLLLKLVSDGLREKQFDILMPRKIPFNDGCIALGQVAIARGKLLDDH